MGRQEFQEPPSASDRGSTLGLPEPQYLYLCSGNPRETWQVHMQGPHTYHAETVQRNSTGDCDYSV